jgi:hypothetical protein
MENGYYLGTKANQVKVISGSASPTTGTWNKGDQILNRNPTNGGYTGWICVEASSDRDPSAVWKGFGLIET